MITINIHEAKTQLSRLLMEVETHHEIVRICRNGKPIAQLVPINEPKVDRLKQHSELQGIKILGDITAPLTEDEWPEEFR